MAICSNCGKEVTPKNRKCPFCHHKLPKDSIGPLPSVINNPEKITDTEPLAEKKLKIKTIPLKVKPTKAPKTPKKEQTPKKKTQSNLDSIKYKSTIKIIVVLILLVLNIFLIVNIVTKNEKNPVKISNTNTKQPNKATTNVLGTWKTANDGLFVFNDDYNFYWYDSYKEQDNNYYAGSYNYKSGKEALEEMGYTEEEFKNTFGEDIEINNVYSMNLLPTIAYKGYQDTSSKDLKENESWWFILIVKKDKTAIGYNKTLDLRYNLIQN